MKKTLRNINRFNIKRYAKNIQKYLDRRRKFNISTREKGAYRYRVYFIKINHTRRKI